MIFYTCQHDVPARIRKFGGCHRGVCVCVCVSKSIVAIQSLAECILCWCGRVHIQWHCVPSTDTYLSTHVFVRLLLSNQTTTYNSIHIRRRRFVSWFQLFTVDSLHSSRRSHPHTRRHRDAKGNAITMRRRTESTFNSFQCQFKLWVRYRNEPVFFSASWKYSRAALCVCATCANGWRNDDMRKLLRRTRHFKCIHRRDVGRTFLYRLVIVVLCTLWLQIMKAKTIELTVTSSHIC